MKLIGGNTYSSLLSQSLKFSLPPKLGETGENRIRFNDFFTKISKIFLYG